jgi:hypothetical protein
MSRTFEIIAAALSTIAILIGGALHGMSHSSMRFQGVKANTGSVTHTVADGHDVLTLSSDFKVPDAPAPHWQIVDSRGNTYLLNRLMIKGERLNQSIIVPDHIADIAKVQIWCAWAEVLLGETSFDSVIPLGNQTAVSSGFQGAKANTGYATFVREGSKRTLMVSEEFVVPKTPAPHWQVVDSSGRVYLLNRVDIKDNKFNRTITVPSYVPDIAKVQMWCAFAETLLGEATFETPVG